MKKLLAIGIAVLLLLTFLVGCESKVDKLTKEQAKEIAIEHAGLKKDDVTRINVTYDKDDGVEEYDIDFYAGEMEYEYEINALTGDVISHSAENIRD